MTMVTITITLPIEGGDTASPEIAAALDALADVMLVQAEDGLWSLGSPESENEDGPSEYLRGIGSGQTVSVTIHPPEVAGSDIEAPGYHYRQRELHFPVFAVYDNGGNLEVAFPTEQQAIDYVEAHR